IPPSFDSRTSKNKRLTRRAWNSFIAALSSAHPCPFRRLAGVTARFRISASSPACRPTMKPLTLRPSSLTSATTPLQPSNSLTPHSVHCAASKDPFRISVAAAASVLRNARIVEAVGRGMVSAPMRRVPFPQNLRVRPSHVIRIQRKRICELPRRHSVPRHSRDSYPQEAGNQFEAFIQDFARFPFLLLEHAIHITRSPRDLFTPRKLARRSSPIEKLQRSAFRRPLPKPSPWSNQCVIR